MLRIAEIIAVSGGQDAISISPQEAIPVFVRHHQYSREVLNPVISIYILARDVGDVSICQFPPFSGGSL